jgi:hypothetical protein
MGYERARWLYIFGTWDPGIQNAYLPTGVEPHTIGLMDSSIWGAEGERFILFGVSLMEPPWLDFGVLMIWMRGYSAWNGGLNLALSSREKGQGGWSTAIMQSKHTKTLQYKIPITSDMAMSIGTEKTRGKTKQQKASIQPYHPDPRGEIWWPGTSLGNPSSRRGGDSHHLYGTVPASQASEDLSPAESREVHAAALLIGHLLRSVVSVVETVVYGSLLTLRFFDAW